MATKKSTRVNSISPKRQTTKKQSIKSKNKSFLSRLLSNKPLVLVVLGVALLGIFIVTKANAATTNFEAENASPSSGATTKADDTSASAGKYVQFASSASTQSKSIQRFPGDPNPLVTSKSYWGAAVGGNDDPTARHETPTGKSLSLRRTFFGWGSRTTSMVTTAKNDLAANRLPWVSTKTPTNNPSDWGKMGNGTYDKEIDEMLIALDNIGGADKPVWLTVWHEPENDKGNSADWRAMQKRIRARMDTLKSQGKSMDNIAFAPILMSWTFHPSSGRNMNDWWVDGIWDFFGVDPYCYNTCSSKGKTILTDGIWNSFITYLNSKNIPIGIGEWGETNKAAVWAQSMKDVWAYGFNNKKDIVGYAAFDSGLNPPSGDPGVDTTMPKEVLAVFHDILKNDPRVMRAKELDSSVSTKSFGSLTAKVSVPTSSNYSVWVRINAPDSSNNAVNMQVDKGAVTKVGDGNIVPSTWTWVNWKNGDINSKTNLALSAGSHEIILTGVEPGVKVDRVLITDETCIPTEKGENCTAVVPPTTNPSTSGLNVNIVSPSQNQTVTGITQVKVEPATNIQEVSFRINGVWQTTIKNAPFTWPNWDTTKSPNGATTVTIRARKVGDPGSKYTEKSVVVNVANGVATPQPPTNAGLPTKPANLTAQAAFSPERMGYVFNISWSPSPANETVANYIVKRNGTQIGNSIKNSFTDGNNLSADIPYRYTVSAVSSSGKSSPESSITVKASCFLVWCSTTALQ